MLSCSFRQCPYCGYWVPQSDDCPEPSLRCQHVRTVPLSAVQGRFCESCDE